jgi:hypothetical protein
LARREIMGRFGKFPDSPVGWWKVTTEGDCEGRTTRDLGIFYGHIVDIAAGLANKCTEYSLQFEPASVDIPEVKERYTDISLCIGSGTWDMKPEDRAKWMQEFFAKAETKCEYSEIKPSYYAAISIKVKPR